MTVPAFCPLTNQYAIPTLVFGLFGFVLFMWQAGLCYAYYCDFAKTRSKDLDPNGDNKKMRAEQVRYDAQVWNIWFLLAVFVCFMIALLSGLVVCGNAGQYAFDFGTSQAGMTLAGLIIGGAALAFSFCVTVGASFTFK